jgi:hypothetical protein
LLLDVDVAATSASSEELPRQLGALIVELFGDDRLVAARALHDLAIACEDSGRWRCAEALWLQARSVIDEGVGGGALGQPKRRC